MKKSTNAAASFPLRRVSGIVLVIALSTLLCSAEIEADHVPSEVGTHVDALLDDKEQGSSLSSPVAKVSSAKVSLLKHTEPKKAGPKKTSHAILPTKSGRKLLETSSSSSSSTTTSEGEGSDCGEKICAPVPSRVINSARLRGRVEADFADTNKEDADPTLQTCAIKDLGFVGGSTTEVQASQTLYTQPCATLHFDGTNGNLEFNTAGLAAGVTPQGQCTENDANANANGELYTNQWGYSRGILGTRKEADKASDNTKDQMAKHVMANFPGSTTVYGDNSCRSSTGAYLMLGSHNNRRQGNVTSTCLKDPDLLTAPSISAYTDANHKTQRATVQFAIIDQNNYFNEDESAPDYITQSIMKTAHGNPIVPHVPVEVEVCINEAEQSKHFHPDEQIPNIVSLFEQSSDEKPLARFNVVTKGIGGAETVAHRYYAAGGGASKNYRFVGSNPGERTVCLRFDQKDFNNHGSTSTSGSNPATFFGCKATDDAVEAMAPYDFPRTHKIGNDNGFNPAWTKDARDAYWSKPKNHKHTPRVYGSSSSYNLTGTPMKVYPYNSLYNTSIQVASTCSKKLEIELDSSLQGSLVVDIRAVQRQPGTTKDATDREFYSSSQTMINFAPYHTGVKAINSVTGPTTSDIKDVLPAPSSSDPHPLLGLAPSMPTMRDVVWTAKSQLETQGVSTNGLGGEFGVREKHQASAATLGGQEHAYALYDASPTKTSMTLKLNDDTVGNNAPRIFDAATNSIDSTWLQNPRVRFSLTLKDETECEVQSLTTDGAYSPATGSTPSAIDKRFFGVKETDAKWDSISRFHLESSYVSRGDSSSTQTQVKLGRANTKKMDTDIFYAIDIDDQKKEEGLTFSQVKDFFKNMKIRLAASYNTHMCGRFRLKAIVDVINMRSCGRYTEEVDVSKVANWPGTTTTDSNNQLVWNVSPSSVLPNWIKKPKIIFRQMPGPSEWCEKKDSAGAITGNCVTRKAASFGNMAITTVKVGATEPVKSAQTEKLTALEFATESNSADAVARSKEWMPQWADDREADQDKVTKYSYEQYGNNLIAPQLTWFSTLELADLNLGQCKGPGKERQDIEAMISTMLTKGSQSSGQATPRIGSTEDASYIKGWHSYLPSGEVPSAGTVNTVKDSYVACDYAKGATPGLLNGSNDKCDVGANKLKIRRYTVFPSFHAYALATRKDPQFGQSCLDCTSLFNGAEQKACIRSNKVVYKDLTGSDADDGNGCPTEFGADAYERLRKYLQTFASIGENGIQMALRPVLHQVDMSLTLQTFDFLDKRQTETTKNLLTVGSEANYPLIETARSGKISVIPDMDWTVNPKPWNSLDFVGGTNAVTNELVEDGATGASMGLKMSLPDNLLDGICEREIPYAVDGGYDGKVYQGSASTGAFAATDAKHCTFLENASYKADQRVSCPTSTTTTVSGIRSKCSLSRQNKDCSPSDGKDNRLSGMQLVMSHYGLLPKAELSHGKTGRNSLESISDTAAGTNLTVGQGQCTGEAKYIGKPCHFSQQYIDVSDARGSSSVAKWEFANDMAETRKGMNTCYYNDPTSATFCKSQLLLAKEGSCAAGQSDDDLNACQIAYGQVLKQGQVNDLDKNDHVWTMSNVPNLNFWEVQEAFKAGSAKARLGIQLSKHYNTGIWRNTSYPGPPTADQATSETGIRPKLNVYAWFSTCAKDSDTAACSDDTSDVAESQADSSATLLNQANKAHDGGRRMTVMTKTNNPLTLNVESKWTNHDFGDSTGAKIKWLQSNAKDEAYDKDSTTPAYWTSSQSTTAAAMATFNDVTRNGVSLLYEQEERNNQTSLSKAYKQKTQSLARLVQTEIRNAVKYGDQHLWEATLDFKAKNAAGQWEDANDLWKVERYDASGGTVRIISDFKSHANRNESHTLLTNGYDVYAGGDAGGGPATSSTSCATIATKAECNKKVGTAEQRCVWTSPSSGGHGAHHEDQCVDNPCLTTDYDTCTSSLLRGTCNYVGDPVHKCYLSTTYVTVAPPTSSSSGSTSSSGSGATSSSSSAYSKANDVYDNYRPTTCNVTNTTLCQRQSAFQKKENTLFLREGHDQGLQARTRFIHGGDLCAAGSETDCSRKLSIVPLQDMHMREVTVTLKVLMRTERLNDDGTIFTAPWKSSTKTMKLHMHPAATAPRMCTMHPSNPKQADKDINLCAKSELESTDSNSVILTAETEIDDFSVPSINAENEKRLHMLHYGVIPGMSGEGTYPLEEAPTAEDATRAHFMNESVYLTVRAKLPDRKFVLMRIDEAKNTTGPYMIPLDSYSDCPDQDRYADRTDFAIAANEGIGENTAISSLALTKTSKETPYSSDYTQDQREGMQYRDADGKFLGGDNDRLSKSHRDGGNCFRVKVCTYEYDADTKQLVCRDPNRRDNQGGVLPRFAYSFPRDIHKTDVQIQYYLTQFKDKTISINENGYATASHVQKINLYAHKTMVGEHVDWGTATFTSEQDKKINVDWSSYNGTEAIGMQTACQNLDPEALWNSTKHRVEESTLFSSSPSSSKLTEWDSATSDEVNVKPFISATDAAKVCNKQVTIVPWSYRRQPMNFSVDMTELGTNRDAPIEVKMSWTKLELLKQDGTFANAASASNAFVWNYTNFVQRHGGMERQCIPGESGKDKCNEGNVYRKGHSKRVDPVFTLSLNLNDAELNTMFNDVDAYWSPHTECGKGNAVMRLTVRIEVPREGNVGSTVPPLVETRTIMWVRDQLCAGNEDAAGTFTIGSDPLEIKFRNEATDAESSTTSKDITVKTNLKMATSCIHAGGHPDLCKRSETRIAFEQSSANTAGGAARPLNCEQYQDDDNGTLEPGKWEIRIGNERAQKPANCTAVSQDGILDKEMIFQGAERIFKDGTIFTDAPELYEETQTFSQTFGKDTDQAQLVVPLQGEWKTKFPPAGTLPSFSCVKVATVNDKAPESGKKGICHYTGYTNDPGNYSGFCAGQVTSTYTDKRISGLLQMQKFDPDSDKTAKHLLESAFYEAPVGGIVVTEEDFKDKLEISLNGMNPNVDRWPKDSEGNECHQVKTTMTIGGVEFAKESGGNWKSVVSANFKPISKNANSEKPIIVDLAGAIHVSKTWHDDEDATKAQNVTLKLHDALVGQFYDRAQEYHMLRTSLDFDTKCIKSDGTADSKPVAPDRCTTKMLYIVQGQRSGEWKFTNTTNHSITLADLKTGQTLVDYVERKPTDADRRVIKFHSHGEQEGGRKPLGLSAIRAKIKFNANPGGILHRYVDKYNLALTVEGQDSDIEHDAYNLDIYRSNVTFPSLGIVVDNLNTSKHTVTMKTMLKTDLGKINECTRDGFSMKMDYGFATGSTDAPKKGYAYYRKMWSKDGQNPYSYWSHFDCEECSKQVASSETDGTRDVPKMELKMWNGEDSDKIMQPEMYLRNNGLTFDVVLAEWSELPSIDENDRVAYLYIPPAANACIKAGSGFAVVSGGGLPEGTVINSNCKPKDGDDFSNVLVLKKQYLGEGSVQQRTKTMTMQYLGTEAQPTTNFRAQYSNQIQIHLKSTVLCMDSVLMKDDQSKRPMLTVQVSSNKVISARKHSVGTSVSHRIDFSNLRLAPGQNREVVKIDVTMPLSFSSEKEEGQSCSADQRAGITSSASDTASRCFTGGGPRPQFPVVGIADKDARESFLMGTHAWKTSNNLKLMNQKRFTIEPTSTQAGVCSSKQSGNHGTVLTGLSLRKFAEHLVTGKDHDVDQRMACGSVSNGTNATDYDKSFMYTTKEPEGRFNSTVAVSPDDPKIKCARKELLNTTITLDINELKQCKDYQSMEDKGDDFVQAKNALTVKQIKDTIHHDYAVCASSTSARLGIPTHRSKKVDGQQQEIKCVSHDQCCKDGSCAPDDLDFCDMTTKQCKLATITSLSNCMKVKLLLNTKFNLWTAKAGTNPQTGVMSTMRVLDINQRYSDVLGNKKSTHAKLVLFYEIQSPIKVNAAGMPTHVIGVRGISNVQPKRTSLDTDAEDEEEFLKITEVHVADVAYTSSGDRISRTFITAETRYFEVLDANGVFHADAISKHTANFGLDVNVFNCKIPELLVGQSWAFPKTSIASTCSDAGYESFPASVEWMFTKFDASRDLNIDTTMLKFKSWTPLNQPGDKGSNYYSSMEGRKDWWNANRLGDDVEQLQPTDALVLALGTNNYAEGLSSYIKTVTLMRSVKQIVHVGSSLVTGLGNEVEQRPRGYSSADPDVDGPGAPGGHILADLLVKWPELVGSVTYLSSNKLTWPSISSSPKDIEDFLYDYAMESCIPNNMLYKVTSSTDPKSYKVTYTVGTVIEEVNDHRKNCVCGDVTIPERVNCYSEFARQFKPVRVIEDGRSQKAAIVQSLGGQTAEVAEECLDMVQTKAKGMDCETGGAQYLVYNNSLDRDCGKNQGLLVTTSTIAMRVAMGALEEDSYKGANAYRAKCTGAHNDVLPSMFSAIKDTDGNPIYPEAESMKCAAPNRLGSSDSLIIGSKVINNMRGSSFSISVETELFDPNSVNENNFAKCERPKLKCKQDGDKHYWMATNMPKVMTRTGEFVDGDEGKWHYLVTSDKDEYYKELSTTYPYAMHPGHNATDKPVAVVESSHVDVADSYDKNYTINLESFQDANITMRYGKFQMRIIPDVQMEDNAKRLRHLYAHTDAPADDGEFARVECKPGDVQSWINTYKNGEGSLGRRLLSFNNDNNNGGRKLLSSSGSGADSSDSSTWQHLFYGVLPGEETIVHTNSHPTAAASANLHHYTISEPTTAAATKEKAAKTDSGGESDNDKAWDIVRWFIFAMAIIITFVVLRIAVRNWKGTWKDDNNKVHEIELRRSTTCGAQGTDRRTDFKII